MRDWLLRFTPFFYLGLMLIAAFFSLVIFSWLFILGALVGGILYLITYIRARFFNKKTPDILVTRTNYTRKTQESGRIIDHDDNDQYTQ